MATNSARRIVLRQVFPSYDHQHVWLGWPMEEQARLNTSPDYRSTNYQRRQGKQTLPGLPNIINERGQNFQQWHHISFHLNRWHCVQREGCTHHMQGQAHPHWHARWKVTIPNTVDATTGTVATKEPIQTRVEGTTTGQQRLRPPINQTSHQMDARRMWIPSKNQLGSKP
jgi:hypothetical protein